jgi:sugar lactone lactonase YvrE
MKTNKMIKNGNIQLKAVTALSGTHARFAIVGTLVLMAAVLFLTQRSASTQTRRLPVGQAETTLLLEEGNRPEGIAVSHDGQLFVGNRQFAETTVTNEILVVATDGTSEVLATLPSSMPDPAVNTEAQGLLGLALDNVGNIYAALASGDPATRGVWRVSRPRPGGGVEIERLQGSENITFPNALTFDCDGNLYVSDSVGHIWRAPAGGGFSLWLSHPLLEPLPDDPFGIPLIGVNGIAFNADQDSIYFANTERSIIGRVHVQGDGSPGMPELVTAPFAVPTADGIALDVHGDIHVVLPGFALFGTPPLVKVDAATGAVSATVVNPDDVAKFDVPLSIAFGSDGLGVKTVFITNGDLPAVPGDHNPGVVHAGVGVPGLP